MSMLNLSVKMNDGVTYYGSTPRDVLLQMKLEDWTFPNSILEYKEGIAYRAEVCGMRLVFWDETSFLYAMQEAGICEVIIGGEEFEEKK